MILCCDEATLLTCVLYLDEKSHIVLSGKLDGSLDVGSTRYIGRVADIVAQGTTTVAGRAWIMDSRCSFGNKSQGTRPVCRDCTLFAGRSQYRSRGIDHGGSRDGDHTATT